MYQNKLDGVERTTRFWSCHARVWYRHAFPAVLLGSTMDIFQRDIWDRVDTSNTYMEIFVIDAKVDVVFDDSVLEDSSAHDHQMHMFFQMLKFIQLMLRLSTTKVIQAWLIQQVFQA